MDFGTVFSGSSGGKHSFQSLRYHDIPESFCAENLVIHNLITQAVKEGAAPNGLFPVDMTWYGWLL